MVSLPVDCLFNFSFFFTLEGLIIFFCNSSSRSSATALDREYGGTYCLATCKEWFLKGLWYNTAVFMLSSVHIPRIVSLVTLSRLKVSGT